MGLEEGGGGVACLCLPCFPLGALVINVTMSECLSICVGPVMDRKAVQGAWMKKKIMTAMSRFDPS